MPDLVVRQVDPDDLDHLAAATSALGHEPACCPDEAAPCCQPPEAHTWLSLAHRMLPEHVWAFAVTWKGVPIQFELMEQGPPPTSVATYHLAVRGRPGWFWREAWRPIVDGLLDLGYAKCRGLIRGDLPDYADTLERHYKAKLVGHYQGGGLIFEYPLGEIPLTGFPARRTIPGWEWTAPGDTAVAVREMDVATATAEIRRIWTARGTPSAPQNMADSLRIAEGRSALENATLLGGFIEGVCRAVICLAPSPDPGGVAGRSTVTPFLETKRSGLLQLGFLTWCQQAGYTTLVTWHLAHQQAMIEAGTLKAQLPWTVGRRREHAVEGLLDVAATLARPLAAWTADLRAEP
jgi:hypothetical protein